MTETVIAQMEAGKYTILTQKCLAEWSLELQ